MRTGFPLAMPGQRIGLLGGSFDPPHAGHLHITRAALARFALDRVWWLVSPGNPLKPRGPAPIAARVAAARALVAGDARITVTDLEARLGTRATADTLARLGALYPGVRFVWLMGSDNLVQFHRWERWREILGRVPVGVLARPGSRLAARNAPAARAIAPPPQPATRARLLGRAGAPGWCMVDLPLHPASSSAIRAGGGWPGGGA
ncbi:MAG: nicotinate-nucleotide adenylyltransferase [Gemmobacter sp.]